MDDQRTIPDMRTINAIVAWLGVTIEEVGFGEFTASIASEVSLALPVPEAVKVHLRADRNLQPEQAELLARTFNNLYQLFRSGETDLETGSTEETPEEHGE